VPWRSLFRNLRTSFEIASLRLQLSPVEQATINENLSLSSRGAKRRGDLLTHTVSCHRDCHALRARNDTIGSYFHSNDTKGDFSFIVVCSTGDNCERKGHGNLLCLPPLITAFAGVLAGSLRYSSPATHRQTLSAKGTARNSASMPSVLAARNVLFLAPLRSPQLRRELPRLVVSRSPG